MESNLKQLAMQLDRIMSELTNRLRVSTSRENGLTGVQFFILRYIAENGKLTVTELAYTLGVTLSAITGLVNRLVKMGLAEREQDKEDRRVVWIKLTSKGLELIEKANCNRAKDLMGYLKELPPELQATLPELCTALAKALNLAAYTEK